MVAKKSGLQRANWPRYMLFFFARKYLKARISDGNLSKWRESIKQASKKQNSKDLPFKTLSKRWSFTS